MFRSLRFKTSVVQNVQKWSLVVCIVLLLPVVCLKGLTIEDFDRSLQCTALRRQCKRNVACDAMAAFVPISTFASEIVE